jgi:hypothetical protein
MSELLADPELGPSLRAAAELRVLGAELRTTPAALAISFALTNKRVSSVLFGADARPGRRERRGCGRRRKTDDDGRGSVARDRLLSYPKRPVT